MFRASTCHLLPPPTVIIFDVYRDTRVINTRTINHLDLNYDAEVNHQTRFRDDVPRPYLG